MATKKNLKGYTRCLAFLIHDKLLLESAVLVSLPLFLSLPCLIPPLNTILLSQKTFLSHRCAKPLYSIYHLCPFSPWPWDAMFSWRRSSSSVFFVKSLPNTIIPRHSFGHRILMTLSLWTSTPRCPTGVSDSACPRGPHPASLVPKPPPCGPVGPISWSYSFSCVLQVPALLTWTVMLVSPLALCFQSCLLCCVHGPVHMTLHSCLKLPKDSAISWFRQIQHNYTYLSKFIELNKGWVYSMWSTAQ